MTRVHTPDPDVTLLPGAGVQLACLRWGEAGPLVVLVHGFPDTARTWDLVGPRLAAAGYRVVAPYTRGIAPSEIPGDGAYGSDTLGADISALIDACGESSAIVVGHDFGASAAYSCAGLFPDKVRKLVTVAIPHPASLKLTPAKAWGVRHFLTHRLPGAAARFARRDFAEIRVLFERWSPGFQWDDSELEHTKNAYSAPGSCAAALAYYGFVSPTLPPGLRARITVPTLIVGGHTDAVANAADFEASRRRFTGSLQVEMVPGGHFLHREHPEPFLDVLLPFLAD